MVDLVVVEEDVAEADMAIARSHKEDRTNKVQPRIQHTTFVDFLHKDHAKITIAGCNSSFLSYFSIMIPTLLLSTGYIEKVFHRLAHSLIANNASMPEKGWHSLRLQ